MIETLLQQGESQLLEFKTSFCRETNESLVAFANSRGGGVLLGVNDQGIVVGVDLSAETIKDWLNQVKNSTYPQLIPDVELLTQEGKSIVYLRVQEQPIKPIAYKQRYFKRVQNANHLMSLAEIANEHLKTLNASWDYYLDTRHDLSDLSQEKIRAFIQRIERHQHKTFSDDLMGVLRKYELIKDDKITWAAYLLFLDTFSAITPLQIGRFKSDITIIDNIDIATDLPSQVDIALDFIRKHLMVEFIITGQAERTERFDYPLEAIREIVINMIVHRDYQNTGVSVIKIFDDRIEFFNPGRLYGDLTIEQLLKGDYSSKPRNRAIANMFKEAGIIERYGSGITRIGAICEAYGGVIPKFEEFQHGFRVTLFKNSILKSFTPEVTLEVERLVLVMTENDELSSQEIMDRLSLKDEKHFREAYRQPAIKANLLELTIPDKPRSRLQKYRITLLGKRLQRSLSQL